MINVLINHQSHPSLVQVAVDKYKPEMIIKVLGLISLMGSLVKACIPCPQSDNSEMCKKMRQMNGKKCISGCMAIPLILRPVCGSDGKTYTNDYLLECEQRCHPDLKIAHYGECKEKEEECDLSSCPVRLIGYIDGTPNVCGTDGRTYQYAEHLHCARERCKRHNLEVAYKGKCKGIVHSYVHCTDNLQK